MKLSFDDLKTKMTTDKKSRFAIWGAGEYAREILADKEMNPRISCVVDQNHLQGRGSIKKWVWMFAR